MPKAAPASKKKKPAKIAAKPSKPTLKEKLLPETDKSTNKSDASSKIITVK